MFSRRSELAFDKSLGIKNRLTNIVKIKVRRFFYIKFFAVAG